MTKTPARGSAFLLVLSAALGVGTAADASVSIAVSFDQLVHDSSAVTVATATEAQVVWENGRIVTYTHLHVDRAVAGNLHVNDAPWVASLGGIVGTTGQVVDGEPTLHVGMPYLLFLRPDPSATTAPGTSPSVLMVTARAQGQFRLKAASVTPDRTKPGHYLSSPVIVIRNPGVGEILPMRPTGLASGASATTTPKAAVDQIADRPIDDVAKEISSAWTKSHAP
ncbi:MAG: hypothetical protein ABI183_16985 [Polyangiaceae bacterium]